MLPICMHAALFVDLPVGAPFWSVRRVALFTTSYLWRSYAAVKLLFLSRCASQQSYLEVLFAMGMSSVYGYVDKVLSFSVNVLASY